MIKYLLDTNVISESSKKVPDSGFIKWFSDVNELNLYTSCLVLGEIKKGIFLQKDNKKRNSYNIWLTKIIDNFEDRIINIDKDISLLWGELIATGQKFGKTPPIIDALIAAQCIKNNLILVTRNKKDFEQFTDLKIFSPWLS